MSDPRKWCVHYNGRQNEICDAGIRYSAIAPAENGLKFQCLGYPATGRVCGRYRAPTKEEIEQKEREFAEHAKNCLTVRDAIVLHVAKSQALQGVIECPICTQPMRYAVASCNGHVHARCSSEGCVSFRE